MSRPLTFDLSSVAFFGRSFAEYVDFFDLDPPSLVGQRVLDVAGGPASFTAAAARRGILAQAVDPLYGLGPAALTEHIRIDYRRVVAQMHVKAPLFRSRSFPSIAAAEASRRQAAHDFMADYEDGFAQGRYIGAALPQLPFPDGMFSVVLCAHLFFIYARHFDYAWHLAACRELCRVSGGEVRIHPLCGADGASYPELPRLLHDLQGLGWFGRIVNVNYEFFVGSGTALVLQRDREA